MSTNVSVKEGFFTKYIRSDNISSMAVLDCRNLIAIWGKFLRKMLDSRRKTNTWIHENRSRRAISFKFIYLLFIKDWWFWLINEENFGLFAVSKRQTLAGDRTDKKQNTVRWQIHIPRVNFCPHREIISWNLNYWHWVVIGLEYCNLK